MHHLLMRALHGATADPIAQTQIFVVVHAPGMLAVVGDETLQLFAQLRRLGPHALEVRDALLHLAGAQVFGDPMDPTTGQLRFLPRIATAPRPRHAPGHARSRGFRSGAQTSWPGSRSTRLRHPRSLPPCGGRPQPNSRSWAYRRAKMVSASPRQLTRKRRTTEWRPGEVSTRSPGNSSTPDLTSWNWPA